MTLNDIWPRFQGHDIFDIEYLRNDTRYSHSYYRTSVGSRSYALYRMVTFPINFTNPLPSFQVHGIFEVEYIKNGASYGQSYYSTLIENHTWHMEWYHVWWLWLTPKCVARVCQHQLSFCSLIAELQRLVWTSVSELSDCYEIIFGVVHFVKNNWRLINGADTTDSVGV